MAYNYVGSDSDGISGIRYMRDDLGRVICESYLTYIGDVNTADNPEDYQVIGTETGLCCAEYNYDDFDCVEMRLLDSDNQLTPGIDKYCSQKCVYVNHNCVSVSYCGVNGMPVMLDDGYASATIKYDLKGNRSELSLFGPD